MILKSFFSLLISKQIENFHVIIWNSMFGIQKMIHLTVIEKRFLFEDHKRFLIIHKSFK